jgi:hypothetical protein
MAERTESEFPAAGFDTYDEFVKAAIKEYYERGFAHRKGNFIALLIASGQTLSIARDTFSVESGLKKMAVGAAGVVALRYGLGLLLGPLAPFVGIAAAASLAAFFVKNQKDIQARIPRYKELLSSTKTKFDEIQSGYRANRYEARERNLMVDGLQKRFLADLDEV